MPRGDGPPWCLRRPGSLLRELAGRHSLAGPALVFALLDLEERLVDSVRWRAPRPQVIAYLDPSVLAHAYRMDESGHDEAAALLADAEVALVTGTWSRVEVSGALVRAARAGRGDEQGLLSLLDTDLAEEGAVTVVAATQTDVEREALRLVRRHALRATDAWHLATAHLILPRLAEAGEETGFASRDEEQASVATALGLRLL